ncbi:Glycosyltransferase involved in cell wall bisynthesis [Marinomonas polaris DSM 16579]|uniref:Glycosyltransferase involved in cell wall bisynthesis n=1 Tax=Marinomonas polaris DSM 16579 TaxID=1122206 RepID=A0A1M4TMX9_9GAMM|nr:glycosyltransferase family 2 protein [Marinomonas polaris]SHE45830.1 Glycosyltransferase involved in cell wall bisynthesis [Marinomonas polaris DSM 16579]
MVPFLSVVLPAKNEQGNIGLLIKEIHKSLSPEYAFEVVLTDDGSDDGTAQVAIDTAKEIGCNLQVIYHANSCGQSTAVLSAVRHAKGEWIITSDADGQNDPNDYAKLIQQASLLSREHFCVAGYRKKRLDTAWVRFQSRVANNIRQKLLNDGVPDSGCGLKLFPKNTFLALPYFDHMHRFLPALIKRIDGEIVVCQVNHRDRNAGVSNYNAWNRAWVGIIDIVGVIWLNKRAKYPVIAKIYSSQD